VFGTDLFNEEAVSDTTTKFRNATVALSLGTYVIAFLVLWGVYKMDAVAHFLRCGKDLLLGLVLGLMECVAAPFHRLRREKKKEEDV